MTETVTTQGLSRPELWEAISTAKLPHCVVQKTWFEQAKEVTFTDRLQITHNLSDKSVLRIVAEYRRYLYLKVIDCGPLTPSMWVGRAWQQHLNMDGGKAWKSFCKEILRCHVEQTTGLSSGEARAFYTSTLDLYRREFKEEPPKDIWPGDAERRRQKLGNWIYWFGMTVIILGVILCAFTLAFNWKLGFVSVLCLLPGVIIMATGSSWRHTPWPPDPFDKIEEALAEEMGRAPPWRGGYRR